MSPLSVSLAMCRSSSAFCDDGLNRESDNSAENLDQEIRTPPGPHDRVPLQPALVLQARQRVAQVAHETALRACVADRCAQLVRTDAVTLWLPGQETMDCLPSL